MRGSQRCDHQAWLDWAAFGVRARRDRKVRLQLENRKEADSRASSSVFVPSCGSKRRHDTLGRVDDDAGRKRKKSPFRAYQTKFSRAVTGKDDAGFIASDLGYTVEQLRAHLERQFSARMSWSNYAGNLPYRTKKKTWHIDHITPKSRFAADDLKGAFSLANLRPLWATENMRKGVSKTHLL